MCMGLSELKVEKANAAKGIKHSHKHEKADAARIKELHRQEREESGHAEHAEELVTVGR